MGRQKSFSSYFTSVAAKPCTFGGSPDALAAGEVEVGGRLGRAAACPMSTVKLAGGW